MYSLDYFTITNGQYLDIYFVLYRPISVIVNGDKTSEEDQLHSTDYGQTVAKSFLQRCKYNHKCCNHLSRVLQSHEKGAIAEETRSFGRRFPVLLQGPTSSGKTSLVSYMAAQTGHRMIRINNNEYTDLQEYLGTYIADATGKLIFQEGALVQAMRKGYWVVLDELNLAPSEVLEALNRY